MNLDELTQEIRSVSANPAVQNVANQLAAWKESTDTTDDLSVSFERYLGNIWLDSSQDHERIYTLWAAFRRDCIDAIHGMTLNERLQSFSLLDRSYSSSEPERQAMYTKLRASVG